MGDNSQLNLNRARSDKFSFILSDIPSSRLLLGDSISTMTSMEINRELIYDHNIFYLSLQSVNLPGISLGDATVQTMFSPQVHTDMRYTFDSLTTEVRLDNNYIIYQLMVLWLMLIKNPEGFNQFNNLETFKKTTVRGTLIVRENIKEGDDYNPVMTFDFIDLRPISIPQIPLNFSDTGNEISMSIGWQYSYFLPRDVYGQPLNILL